MVEQATVFSTYNKMKNKIKISLKTSQEVHTDLKKIIGKEVICLTSYLGGGMNSPNEYYVKDYVEVFFAHGVENVSKCSIQFNCLFLENYHFSCTQIQIKTYWELCKHEDLTLYGIIMSQVHNFRVAKIEIFGEQYENRNYRRNHFVVDMDTFILFTSSTGEQILVMPTDRYRVIQLSYDKKQIERIINESNRVGVKRYQLQTIIE